MNDKCCKCGSGKIIPLAQTLVKAGNLDNNLYAVILTNPDAFVFTGAHYAKLKANICGECGYTELFAENSAALYDAYLKTQS